MTNILDNLDRDILKALENDARQSKAHIAERLRVSKTVVSYRIHRLEKKGIIKSYRYISNQAALGLLSFGVLIRFQSLFLEEQAQIINRMRLSKQFNWVSAVSGRWDAIAVAIEDNAFSFNRRLEAFFIQHGKYIKEYHFYIDYEGSISPLNYLYTEPYPVTVGYGNAGHTIVLSELEASVLKKLQRNPQLSLLSMAGLLDKTYATVKSKYQDLIIKQILLRSAAVINHRSLGYEDAICLYNIAPNPERTRQLLEFCIEHPNIVRYSRCLGHFNLILNIHTRDSKHLKEITAMLNRRFSDIIINYDLVQTVDV